jgi:hypothetical protein
MNKADLEKLKAEIEDNHKADMAAIHQLLSIYGEKRQETTRILASSVEAHRPKQRMSQRVEEIIKSYGDNFSISDICLKFAEKEGRKASWPVRLAISQVINKLRHRNPPQIDVVQGGKGSRSGIYKIRTN